MIKKVSIIILVSFLISGCAASYNSEGKKPSHQNAKQNINKNVTKVTNEINNIEAKKPTTSSALKIDYSCLKPEEAAIKFPKETYNPAELRALEKLYGPNKSESEISEENFYQTVRKIETHAQLRFMSPEERFIEEYKKNRMRSNTNF